MSAPSGPAFRAAFRAELLKILTVRSLRVGAVLAALALPLTSLLVVSGGGLGEADTVTSGAATGSLALLLGYGAWAATVAGGEYVQHTVTVSLALVPHRPLLYAAKTAAAAAVAGTGAAVGGLLSLLLVRAVTPTGHELGRPGALLAVVLAAVTVAAVGVAVGMLSRSSTAGIAIVAAALLLPKAAAGLLGSLQDVVVGASPGTVITQFVDGAQLSAQQSFPGGAAAAATAMLAGGALVVVLASVRFSRSDG